MADVQNSINPIPPPPLHKDNLPMLYYGLVVIGTATAVLAVYNLVIIRWCTAHRPSESNQPSIIPSTNSIPHDSNLSCTNFKYKKHLETNRVEQLHDDECSVCLSGFEDGEDVSELPKCRHSFHAKCIGMWLYSHFDCPLCRQRVEFVATYHNVV